MISMLLQAAITAFQSMYDSVAATVCPDLWQSGSMALSDVCQLVSNCDSDAQSVCGLSFGGECSKA